MTTKQAVDKLRESLKEDDAYYDLWKLDIAMVISDTIKDYSITPEKNDFYIPYGKLYEISNNAADKILKQLVP